MQDEVDELMTAWRRERPDLSLEPMALWSRVKRLEQYLDMARRSAYAEHGLEIWEFDVLAALRRAGEPYRLTPGQLLKETHVTSGTMTNRVDRLVERGFVVRESHPVDGRGVLVTLTTPGRQRVDAALDSLLTTETALLGSLSGERLDRIADDLRVLLLAQIQAH
ncbi:MarR family transcriptional regulator [Tessaracoccus sp. SD287]|uniref:MarR family winged helix-turn-helix transcriptional regulator n=1 Tax=Tessaracoccus sp. SD287 TaxID=2782008 RepID=UPI001A970699|nr:MarR family transcriptional regulator [Tessaracoccus sp. SD287]MBO1031067.1 MarR family transcriptional regulator [Tessaracoccus sp. SD287]